MCSFGNWYSTFQFPLGLAAMFAEENGGFLLCHFNFG